MGRRGAAQPSERGPPCGARRPARAAEACGGRTWRPWGSSSGPLYPPSASWSARAGRLAREGAGVSAHLAQPRLGDRVRLRAVPRRDRERLEFRGGDGAGWGGSPGGAGRAPQHRQRAAGVVAAAFFFVAPPRSPRASGLVRRRPVLALLALLVMPALALLPDVQALGSLGGSGASRHAHLYLVWQVEQIVRPSPRLDHVRHQLEPLLRGHAQGGKCGRYTECERRVIGGPADAPEVPYLARVQPRAQRVGSALERFGTRRRSPGLAQRAPSLVESRGEHAHRRDHAVGRHPLGAALDRLLDQWLDRQAAGCSVSRDPLYGAHHVSRDAPVQARRDVLRCQPARRRPTHDNHEGEPQRSHKVRAPCVVTATTLFRRPNPSSTAGAAGSATQRRPSTTNAYWCWPTGSARVVVHTPSVPAGTSGAAV